MLCIVCTCAHSFFSPFNRLSTTPRAFFTFSQTEDQITNDLAKKSHEAFLIYSPGDFKASDPERDPFTNREFSLPHDISLFIVIKESQNDEANSFPVRSGLFDVQEHSDEEVKLYGYPLITESTIEQMILPDMEKLNIKPEDVTKAFHGEKVLIVSSGTIMKKTSNDALIAISNPAALRMGGCPLVLNNEIIGILVGSLPLDKHIKAVKIGILARENLNKAIEYIRISGLENEFAKNYLIPIPDLEENQNHNIDIIEQRIDGIIDSCYHLFSNAYFNYYLENPDALRYNLCLLSSSIYFKSVLLLSKQIEKISGDFTNINHFLKYLKKKSYFELEEKKFGFNYLSAKLNENFDNFFSEKMNQINTNTEENDLLNQENALASFTYRNNNDNFCFCNFVD